MATATVFNGVTGINNRISPSRLRYNRDSGIGELAEAVNCDIDDSGMISRRQGRTILDSGNFLNVFCKGGDCFAVEDRGADCAIMKVNSDLSLTGIRSGIMAGQRVSFEQVGGRTYYMNGYESGYIEEGISYPWHDSEHVGGETTRVFYSAIGTKIAWHKSRMWVVDGKVIWLSEPDAFGKFNKAKMFLQFGTDVMMIKPVESGVWVSDSEKTGFVLTDGEFKDWRWIKKSHFPAHEWSENIELVDLSQTYLETPGLSAIWSSDEGLTIGTEEGQLLVPTLSKLEYPTGGSGATVSEGVNVINSVF